MDCLVVYESREEMIVTTKGKEPEVVSEFFDAGSRNIEEYDRSERIAFSISSQLRLD